MYIHFYIKKNKTNQLFGQYLFTLFFYSLLLNLQINLFKK